MITDADIKDVEALYKLALSNDQLNIALKAKEVLVKMRQAKPTVLDIISYIENLNSEDLHTLLHALEEKGANHDA